MSPQEPLIQQTIGRRTWVKLLPALAAVLAAQTPPTGASSAAVDSKAGELNRETMKAVLKAAGLGFPDDQIDMMLPSVNEALQSYRKLREIKIPLDTEPATRFQPLPPGVRRRRRYIGSRVPPARRHGSVDELAFLPAHQLAHLLRSRQVTSIELTRMYLARLKKFAPALNCVITLTEDLALRQAAMADHHLRAGRRHHTLQGVPWGAKDLFATKGILTTWGAEPYRSQMIDQNATVVDRLNAAGAVLLAKLSMGSLAQGGLWYGGLTRNPWRTEESSSGSSAGSASATAAGLVGFALGTETLGSVLSPSTRCGVAGLRPTYGRISRYGAMGLSWTMDKVGPIARSIEDCALVLNAIYGPDGYDTTVRDVPFEFNARMPVNQLRVGIVQADFDKTAPEDQVVFRAALADLDAAQMRTEPVVLPDFQEGPLNVILNAEAAAAFDDLTRDGGIDKLTAQSASDWPNQFRSSRAIPAVEYIRAQRARTLLMEKFGDFLSRWDVLVSPLDSPLLLITNLTGHPQACVPCGFVNGKPRSLVLTGHLYDEGVLLRVALAFEKATKWHGLQPPGFAVTEVAAPPGASFR